MVSLWEKFVAGETSLAADEAASFAPGVFFVGAPLDDAGGRRRNPLRRLRGIPMRFVLPNLVTLLALCLGLTGIRFAAEGRFEYAVYAIVFAAILDGLDGRIARMMKGTSRFGAELDGIYDARRSDKGCGIRIVSAGIFSR